MECTTCGKSFKRIATHYASYPDHQPGLPDRTHQLIRGLLLGDGHVAQTRKNSNFQINNTNREFLEWLDVELGTFSSGVRLRQEATDNHAPQYGLHTSTHSGLNQYREWYSSGTKRYPDDLTLSPSEVKMWFVGDGSLMKPEKNNQPYIQFACMNESDRPGVIEDLFERIGFEARWTGDSFRFTVSESNRLWEYMGRAPPGFGYKWPEVTW